MKTQAFEIYDNKMPGFNEMINAAKTLGSRSKGKVSNSYTRMKKKWMNNLGKIILESGIEPVPSVYLDLTWQERSKRRDPDNIAAFIKFILDALQQNRILENDGWTQVLGWENNFEIGPKRGVKVRMYSYGDDD